MKRKKRLMRAGVLTAVFVFAVIIFSYITNRGNGNMTADMGTATRPQITFSYNGYALNPLPAYTKKMDIPAVRDTITPATNGRIQLNLNAYDNTVNSLSYSVYTLDGEEKILEDRVESPKREVALAMDGEGILSEERVLEIVLTLDNEKEFYLYTRVKETVGTEIVECLDYVLRLHENILEKENSAEITAAIEPNEQGDNTTFGHVTIHSDYSHVTWGGLEPDVVGKESWNIKELNETYTSVQLSYRVTCKGEENESDIYNVKEFFRVRRSKGRGYLLDYDRRAEQVLDPSRQILGEKGITLGITDEDVSYMVNKDATIVSYVQANELWNYNHSTDEVSLVFSFAAAENTDMRNLFGQHEIRLLEMDGDGNTVFAVIGYMNRGEHEGEVGIAVYNYNIAQNSVEEKAFVDSRQSYERTVEEMGELLHYNVDKEELYMLVDGTLYKIYVSTGYKDKLVTGLSDAQYVVSGDGRMAAYQEGSRTSAGYDVAVLDLQTGKERKIICGPGESLIPLGFVGADFVYGISKTEDIGNTVSGQEVVPIYRIDIEDENGETVKTYEQSGIYILGAKLQDNMITLERAMKTGTSYTPVPEDYITNNEEEKKSNIYPEKYATELKESQMRLVYEEGIADRHPKLLKPKQVLHERPVLLTLEREETGKNKSYVYGYGELQGVYGNVGTAIQEAEKYGGVVVSKWQTYIWGREDLEAQYYIEGKEEEVQTIRAQIQTGRTPMDIMQESSGGKGIDLTGCASEQLLCMVAQNAPVLAMSGPGTGLIIVGYTTWGVICRDIVSGEEMAISYGEVDAMTEGSGYTYVSYVT